MISKNTKKGSVVYYNNNKAILSAFLHGNIALIVVKLLPINDTGIIDGTCQGCLVGDSDNKIPCTCDDYEAIYEEILEQQEVTEFVITVPVSMLYEKPFALVCADEFAEEIQNKIDGVKKELAKQKQELKEILALHAVIKSNISRLKEQQAILLEID